MKALSSLTLRTARPTATELPLDITHYIIQSFDREEDVTTIATCAQVCTLWLRSSRLKLYRSVVLRSLRQWKRFKRLLLSRQPSVAGGIKPYLANTHTLVIGPAVVAPPEALSSSWAHIAFRECEPYMQKLEHMVISCVDWQHPYEIGTRLHYPLVATLDIKSCGFADICEMHDLVYGFPALKKLSLGIEFFASKPRDPIELDSLSVRPPLERLEIYSMPHYMSLIVSWLLVVQFHARWSLRHLTELVWRPSDYKYQAPSRIHKRLNKRLHTRFLSLMEDPSLETIRLTVCQTPRLADPRFANLRILDITREEMFWVELLRQFAHTTSALAAHTHHLEEARLEYEIHDFPATAINLNRLCGTVSKTLLGPGLPKLRKFSLVLNLSAVRSRAMRPWPIDLRSATVADLVAQYDTAPMTLDELSVMRYNSNPGVETAQWTEVLANESAGILQRRIQDQFKLLSSRVAVNIHVEMKLFLRYEDLERALEYGL